MSDTVLNAFVAQFADAAARTAFVPSPPSPASGPESGYVALQQDTGELWSWDSNGSAWVLIGSGGGNVSASGTLTANALVLGAGSQSVAVLGSLGTTTTVLHGNAAGAPTFGAVSLTADVTGVLPVANGGTGISSGFSPLQLATLSLTNAQILALPTTPVTVIAAPGAGFRIKPHALTYQVNCVAASYSGVNTTYASLQLQTPAGNWLSTPIINDNSVSLTDLTTLLTTAANQFTVDVACAPVFATPPWNSPILNSATSDADNALVQIALDNNGSGNLGGGDAANGLHIKIYYTVEAIV